MEGGPVGHFEGEYVNGRSSSASSSQESSPRLHFKATVQDMPQPRVSPRAGTWPRTPPVPAELSPEVQQLAAGRSPHASHPIPPLGPHEGEAGGPRSRPYARMRNYTDGDEAGPGAGVPRISRPVELLRRSYDCVVIGSGYGGAVAASRMARTGKSVCVLERGKERWPGEYPSGPAAALAELHWSGNLSPSRYLDDLLVDGGDPTGMYHLIFGRGQNAIVGNGELAEPDCTPPPGANA